MIVNKSTLLNTVVNRSIWQLVSEATRKKGTRQIFTKLACRTFVNNVLKRLLIFIQSVVVHLD